MSNMFKRSSGILMPIFSLPSPYGIGTMGKSAYGFVDFLSAAGQKYWQILPLGHTGYGNSPYQTFSSSAGNPYLIDLDMLVEDGLLSENDLPTMTINTGKVNYEELQKTRLPILHKAFLKGMKLFPNALLNFVGEKKWVTDYALFMAIKEHFQGIPLWEWPDSIKKRKSDSMFYYLDKLSDKDFYIFVQFLFFRQWNKLKDYANQKGIQIIGDLPIYPSADSSDVWVNPELFQVDENLLPSGIAGVPPDLYSETGQMWGNPTYNWDAHRVDGFSWWIERIKNTRAFADVIRIDHFRGLYDYWEIPQGETTALNGRWLPGPKMELFDAIKKELGDIPIVAEDLGIITDEVREFLKESGYPGMRVIIFGLSADEDNMYLPHNWEVNSVGYTSTHDSETFQQKMSELPEVDREFALDYIGSNSPLLGLSAIRSAVASPARVVIIPIQDLLSLGKEGRMNIPSTVGDWNWSWRLKENQLTDELAKGLYRITKTFKRC